MQDELDQARRALLESSRTLLPAYLVFGAGEVLDHLPADEVLSTPRNSRARERERHLLLYLQRVCAKNDTFSAFGPSAWGKIVAQNRGGIFEIRNGSADSNTYLERWTAHAIALRLNADPETRAEIPPRLHPNFRGHDSLDAEGRALLAQCDGRTPAFAITADVARLERLVEQGAIRWEMEVPALEPDPLSVIIGDLRAWRENEVRSRWLNALEPLAELPARFRQESDSGVRAGVMSEAQDRLAKLGYERRSSQRFLYAATNPIGEEVSRRDALVIDQRLTEELERDFEPWIDLWRDTYAFVAHRVSLGLRRLLASAPLSNGSIDLASFLRHCEAQKMSLQHHGIVALATIAFQEVKLAFRERLRARADAPELKLTAEDCHFLRDKFEFPRFDEYTFPSADLQISAASAEAIERGEYEWVVSELHPPVAMLHHCFFWNCPDRAALAQALASTTFGRPTFHFGFFATDFTSHTAVQIFDGLPELSIFVAAERGDPKWKTVLPSEAEVYVDDTTGDVALRERKSGQHLGSFARAWLIPLGFHPFHFGLAPHTPRLRCGKVIVQRRAWVITLEEFPSGNFAGVSADLVLGVETLRAARDLPRYIYIRPTEQALRRSGAEGRDKDTKPVFIDLESYLSLEIFYRWLKKAGELEATEMLPDPAH
ncbi:MAG: lantibiotic dehydratase family protein, partial [Verrucomicrobiota bacterium]|nr:lantibiotic dehydratase family protein [Verrucomicrobiota bacterium]